MHSKSDRKIGELWLCSASDAVRKRWREACGDGLSLVDIDSLPHLERRFGRHSDALILLHLQIPGLAGAEGAVQMIQQHPDARFLIFADRPDNNEGLYLLRHGSYGYSNTYLASRLLARAIDLVESGQVLVSRDLMAALVRMLAVAPPTKMPDDIREILQQLTGREREIMHKVCEGMNNKQIANLFNITERTVKAHLSSIFRKTHTNDRLHLAMRMNDYCDH